MLELSLRNLAPSWYVGNLHKWVCAPKGAGFLYLRRDRQSSIHPATISHGYALSGQGIGRPDHHLEFDWTGTQDPSAWLSVPKAIDFIGALLPGGWPEVRRRNRALVLEARRYLVQVLGSTIPTSDVMIGHLAAVSLPPSDEPISHLYGTPFQEELLRKYGIEVPIVPWPEPPHRLVRVSGALYNSREDYETLGVALQEMLGC